MYAKLKDDSRSGAHKLQLRVVLATSCVQPFFPIRLQLREFLNIIHDHPIKACRSSNRSDDPKTRAGDDEVVRSRRMGSRDHDGDDDDRDDASACLPSSTTVTTSLKSISNLLTAFTIIHAYANESATLSSGNEGRAIIVPSSLALTRQRRTATTQ
ncbi:hypothetical protein SCHPADRAFT_98506 [Schizopora paradoxa]|uniref:Uncharacterized protein n=1 Tax=Schizopora paradoxa TaxID=27342 RepID=A0A0H2SNV0_9AGAM|nr:hypothetical protein SCHPADRAFT_98506 [Schizopora paradoxa]